MTKLELKGIKEKPLVKRLLRASMACTSILFIT